jgi:hypothetical protein
MSNAQQTSRLDPLVLMLALNVCISSSADYAPSPNAVGLQAKIDRSVLQGDQRLSIPQGDYYFGNTNLVVQQACNFTLLAETGSGTVHLWFAIGNGILVNQSSDVTLDSISVDYDPPAHYQGA